MIKVQDGLGLIRHETIRFSGGETHVRILDTERQPETIEILATILGGDDVMELLLLSDALRRAFGEGVPLALNMPYLPYARQDRVCAAGEALSLRVFCDLINGQRFASVRICDPHSDVGPALLDRVTIIHQAAFVSRIHPRDFTLVAPDAGALKKIGGVSNVTGRPYIRADKSRDPKTGAITGTVVYSDHLGEKPLLIADDICDGGRTFIDLAPALRKITDGPISLYVTHGIFSRGVEVFAGVFDAIHCPFVFPGVPDHPLLKRI